MHSKKEKDAYKFNPCFMEGAAQNLHKTALEH
jgi:hypothetical protein